jgi:hypothetical protein
LGDGFLEINHIRSQFGDEVSPASHA